MKRSNPYVVLDWFSLHKHVWACIKGIVDPTILLIIFTDFIDFIDGIFLEYREDSIDTPDIQLNIKIWPFYATQQCVYITRTEFFS